MGRPSDFTPELANEICDRLAEGDSLRYICREDDMPDIRSVRRWLAKGDADPESDYGAFRRQYARAREDQADAYADRIVDEGLTATDAAIGRLRMDALKWAASKLAPKKYGDKQTVEHTGEGGGPMTVSIKFV